MKRLTLSLLGTIAAVTCASAADLPVRAAPPPYVAPQAQIFTWSGFYVGANLGYGWAHSNTQGFNLNTGAATTATSHDVRGVVGGGQIGYKWMFAPQWLLGSEADIDGAGMTGSTDVCATGCTHWDQRTDWLASVRGRLGYAWANWLLFGTGGGIWVNHHTDRTITAGGGAALGTTASSSETTGGWTAGGGVEWGFLPHWSAKVEYLYYRIEPSADFVYPANAASNRHTESTTNGNLVRVGVNYHF